jgi:hypothetical protein
MNSKKGTGIFRSLQPSPYTCIEAGFHVSKFHPRFSQTLALALVDIGFKTSNGHSKMGFDQIITC